MNIINSRIINVLNVKLLESIMAPNVQNVKAIYVGLPGDKLYERIILNFSKIHTYDSIVNVTHSFKKLVVNRQSIWYRNLSKKI